MRILVPLAILTARPTPIALPNDPKLRIDTARTVTVENYTIAIDDQGNPLAIGIRENNDVEWWTYTNDYTRAR